MGGGNGRSSRSMSEADEFATWTWNASYVLLYYLKLFYFIDLF